MVSRLRLTQFLKPVAFVCRITSSGKFRSNTSPCRLLFPTL